MIAVLTGREKRTSVSETFDSRDPSGRLLDLGSMTQGVATLLPGLGSRDPLGRFSNLKFLFFFGILFLCMYFSREVHCTFVRFMIHPSLMATGLDEGWILNLGGYLASVVSDK